jgi:hypothetical protein
MWWELSGDRSDDSGSIITNVRTDPEMFLYNRIKHSCSADMSHRSSENSEDPMGDASNTSPIGCRIQIRSMIM